MKNWAYDLLVKGTTEECYRNALAHFSNGSRILDVGIGNGIMIEMFHPLIRVKKLRITGIDIDMEYLRHCQRRIRKYRLQECVEVRYGSVESYDPGPEQRFDFMLFSMSFMLLDNQVSVLRRIRDWLKPGGEIVFAQAMFRNKSPFADLVKPKLKYLTTVDFGKATYEEDFFALLRENGLSVKENKLIIEGPLRSQCRMIVASWPVPAIIDAAAPARGRPWECTVDE
jgi:ubiquinone/menaquinone biosynthesis C-methylase UbiE